MSVSDYINKKHSPLHIIHPMEQVLWLLHWTCSSIAKEPCNPLQVLNVGMLKDGLYTTVWIGFISLNRDAGVFH